MTCYGWSRAVAEKGRIGLFVAIAIASAVHGGVYSIAASWIEDGLLCFLILIRRASIAAQDVAVPLECEH